MEVWFAAATVLIPPSVFAALPPRTERWRYARKIYWIVFPIAVGVCVFNLEVVDPAGPAAVYYGAWLVFVLLVTVWAIATGTIRSEWAQYRQELRRAEAAERAAAEPERPRQPWDK